MQRAITTRSQVVHSMAVRSITVSFSFQELSVKTKDLINNLKKLAVPTEDGGKAKITLETLKQRKLNAVVENFLFNLATAEGLV